MYCNYSKGKFNNQITYIIPSWINTEECEFNYLHPEHFENNNERIFFLSLLDSETNYLELIENKYTPQQARLVLPNALKTELNVCGFKSDWIHLLKQRLSPQAHPDMRYIMSELMDKFNKENIISYDEIK